VQAGEGGDQCLLRGGLAAVLTAELDAEVAELHTSVEECWERIGDLTRQLQDAGAAAEGGPDPGLGGGVAQAGPPGELGARSAAAASGAPTEATQAVRKLQAEFSELQQQAFKIGRESADNSDLAQHPAMNNYIQDLRSFKPRLTSMIATLEGEYARATGEKVRRPKKAKKPKTIRGMSEEEIRGRVRAQLARDDRPYRTKAMDLMSTFRERQLQMQDKQRDLQLTMDGPDWPKEDWPLTTADAKHVGEAEHLIQHGLAVLNEKLAPLGGLGRVHESGDDTVLEQLAALGEMMSGYGDLIDRHVATVKSRQRGKQPRRRQASAPSSDPGRPPSPGLAPLRGPGPLEGNTLRDQLLSFGGLQANREQPFAWLRDGQGASAELPDARAAGGGAGGWGGGAFPAPGAGSGVGAAAGGAPLPGQLGSFGSFGINPLDARQGAAGSVGAAAFAVSGSGNAFGNRHLPPRWSAAVPVHSGPGDDAHSPEL